jgi:hypothetical protein
MELAHRVASESLLHGNDNSEGGASTSVDCKSVSAAVASGVATLCTVGPCTDAIWIGFLDMQAVEKINEKAAEMHWQRSRRKPGRRADGIDGKLSNVLLSLL